MFLKFELRETWDLSRFSSLLLSKAYLVCHSETTLSNMAFSACGFDEFRDPKVSLGDSKQELWWLTMISAA